MGSGQLSGVNRATAFAIYSPRSPARRRAKGSLKSTSGRSFSRARYTATHRAVSEMFRISGAGLDIGRAGYQSRAPARMVIDPANAALRSCLAAAQARDNVIRPQCRDGRTAVLQGEVTS